MSSNSSILIELGQGLSMMLGLPRLKSWKVDERPKNPKRGTFGFNSETKALEYFDGIRWYASLMNKV